MVIVKILPVSGDTPVGKLADAELHFRIGPLEGFKLIGFAVWEHPNGVDLTVSFPARSFEVSGERRHINLLRPVNEGASWKAVRELILDAFAAYETTCL